MDDFIDNVKKVSQHRNHSIKNSYGVYDAYKYYRRNKPKEKKYILTESQYFKIIRNINKSLVGAFLQGEEIKFPKRMGSLYLIKSNTRIYSKDGVLINTYPIDWKATLSLWADDPCSYRDRKIIKKLSRQVFRIKYDKSKANYPNKSVFDFKANREFKLKLKDQIQNNNIDAYIK